jgi:hypothetical protein
MSWLDGSTSSVLLGSPLLTQLGGLAVLDGIPGPASREELLEEALARQATAARQSSLAGAGAETRGGEPQRALSTAGGGEVQDVVYHSPELRQHVSELLGLDVVPSGGRGSYSYYDRPGDFLDLHRDIDTCDVSVITVLQDSGSGDDYTGALVVYPDYVEEPLSAVRQAAGRGGMAIRVLAGQTVVLLGGLVPHQVLPVAAAQARIISVLCLRVML